MPMIVHPRMRTILAMAGMLLAGCQGSSEPRPQAQGTWGCRTTAETQAGFAQGEGVPVRGTAIYPGLATGPLLLEVMVPGPDGHPRIAHHARCEYHGDFEIELPPDLGMVHIVAVVDPGQDGPSAGDPMGVTSTAFAVKRTAVRGVRIDLFDDVDLGAYDPARLMGRSR
jgi:hypothetical protein